MRLRSRGKKQQLQLVQGEDASSLADANTALGLPEELMQSLVKCLSQENVANASMACKLWARVLRAGITKATYVVGEDYEEGRQAADDIQALGKHTAVSDLQLLITSRSSWDYTTNVMRALHALPHLRHLKFSLLVSSTPRKGSCPVFFADGMSPDLEHLESVTIEGNIVPYIALQNTLQNLKAAWGKQPAAGRPATPRHLTIKLGLQPSGSQLPVYQPPTWLKDHTLPCNAGLDADLLKELAGIPSISSLRCQFTRLVPYTMAPIISKLTCLTALTLDEPALSAPVARLLTGLKSLRRLRFSVDVSTPCSFKLSDILQDLDFVQDLHLGVCCSSRHNLTILAADDTALQPLLTRPPANLRGLTVHGLSLQQSYVSQLGALTGLTSLQLVKTSIGQHFLDLTEWRRIKGLKELSLQVSKPMELMQFKFAPPPPPPKPERVLTGPCSSVGKCRKSSLGLLPPTQPSFEDKTKWGDVSALPAAWPHLQALQLSGLPAYAVGNTTWEALGTLTALTSLALQFKAADKQDPRSFVSGCRGLLQFTEEWGVAPPIVRLEHLPAGLRELQLANCYAGVPAEGCLRAGDSLTSMSLSGCWMGRIQKGISTRQGQPLVLRNVIGVTPTDAAVLGDSHPLLLLLQQTRQLQALELINLPWLTDAVLSAAAAAAQTQLQDLSSVSVVGIGNQHLTHGALLGLTGLRKLRELRWHVGDILELMPDVNVLAQLKGLVLLSIPHWLHNQMERWGAYAVLDSMPLCDVNVEVPA